MLKECLEVFKHQLDKNGDKMILHSYVPVDGTYVIVSPKDNSFEIKDQVNIKYNKKTKELEGSSSSYFYYLCECDYNSKLIEMNKPIDGKKIIHSNNYLSFWIKKESLSNGKLTEEIIDNYYDTLLNPISKYSKSKKATDLYESVEKEIGSVDKELLNKIRIWIKENIFNFGIEINGKDYLKLFFEYNVEDYKREGKRYFIPNIYNNNDFNLDVNGKIYGLPNDNMGLNSKKPYLENKTRDVAVPYLIDDNEVILQRKFFDYLMNNAAIGKVNVYINNEKKLFKFYDSGDMIDTDFNGLFLRIKKGKEVEIHDYDIISGYKYTLSKKFEFKNIIDLDLSSKNVSLQNYGLCTTVKAFQNIINEVFFNKFLINNYFTKPEDIKITDVYLKRNLILLRNTLFDFIYKGIDNGVFQMLDKISLNIVKGSISNGFIIKASHQFNLRWSINEYFKKGNDKMADVITDIKSNLRDKINAIDTVKIDSDKEYYFAVGQLVSYLLSKNKAKKKVHFLANPFINSKNDDVIKEKLRNLYKKYNYDINMNGKRFNNLYALILGYKPEGKVNQDMIIAGYLNSSLIYESDNKED